MQRLPLCLHTACISVALALAVSCGIDNYIYLEPPSQILHSATNTDDPEQKYILVKVPDTQNMHDEPDNFKGYEILYRIYNSSSARDQDNSAILNYNTANPTSIRRYLSDTMKYHRLASSVRGDRLPLVEGTTTDRKVYLRLTPYSGILPCLLAGDIDESSDSSILLSGTDYGIPLRTREGFTKIGDNSYRFDYQEIDKDDADVLFTASVQETDWYVQFYMLTYGYDSSYQSIYSSALYLEWIKISS
jgi:hypothetical protein